MSEPVAALYVAKGGCYYGLPDVEPWGAPGRDAREYAGPHPVVAHPPCSTWGHMAPVNQARYGHKIGDDAGCFAAALAAVRKWGGVLEHPADSYAWAAFLLPRPPKRGWAKDFNGGWSTEICQRRYGHRANKRTWLYFVGEKPPRLNWGRPEKTNVWVSTDRPRAVLAAMGIEQMSPAEAKATPPAFRDLLLSIARGCATPPTHDKGAPATVEGDAPDENDDRPDCGNGIHQPWCRHANVSVPTEPPTGATGEPCCPHPDDAHSVTGCTDPDCACRRAGPTGATERPDITAAKESASRLERTVDRILRPASDQRPTQTADITVFAVVHGNYPVEVDSLWTTRELAEKRCATFLVQSMWAVEEWIASSTPAPKGTP